MLSWLWNLPLFLTTVSRVGYALLVLLTIVTTGLSCAALLSQVVRTSPERSWENNVNAFVVGAAYATVLLASFLYCGKRRIAVRLKMQKIWKTDSRALTKDDLPNTVHKLIAQEYVRACLVAYESLPKTGRREGWGVPGTKYGGIQFRRKLLDTIPEIDNLAHIIIPTHPTIKPHGRMLHHFRFILPLLPVDMDGLTPLHYYDAAIQLARNGFEELTEEEFEAGIDAAYDILTSLDECRLEMFEQVSSTQLSSKDTAANASIIREIDE